MGRKYFGTDGIRGCVGEGPINPEFMLKLGWACGKAFQNQKARKRVIIGKDTRISGYMFESALEAGLSAAGMDVRLLGPMPTPAIAYLTRTYRASAGIVISASHNPFQDNGIKFFGPDGMKLDDELESKMEALLDEPMDIVAPDKLGKARRIDDAVGRYVEFCKSTIPSSMNLDGLKVVLDCANGANYQVAPLVFRELGADVHTIGVEPDGININRGVGSTSPKALCEKVLEIGADLGIAFDGDGDRVVMVDHKGEVVDGDEIMYIIARDRKDAGRLEGGVVGTLMTNYGAELAFKDMGIPFERAKVGDRYVMERLKANGWVLGGEGSGHIVCFDKATTGDGVVSSLQVLIAMWSTGQTLHELKNGMSKLPQVLKNVRIKERIEPMSNEKIAQAVKTQEQRFDGSGRVLLRASGTEPLIRVMAEGTNMDLVTSVVDELVDVVNTATA